MFMNILNIAIDMVSMIPGIGMTVTGMIVIMAHIGDIDIIHTGIVMDIHMLYMIITIMVITMDGIIMVDIIEMTLNHDRLKDKAHQHFVLAVLA
jgi:hypothetical protein